MLLTALLIAIALATLLSLGLAAFDLRCLAAARQLAALPAERPLGLRVWPRVTLVIAARDEAATIGPALRSKLADDYPHLEVLVVDDRSSDGTGTVARRIAEEDPRLRVLRIDELPPGWLGKVHAMERGARAATGEWLLFADADVHFAPGTLRRAVAHAVTADLDLVAAYPELLPSRFALDATLAVLMRVLGRVAPVMWVRDPRSGAAMGSGSFNLLRREAFERTPGFGWLRMEAADDVGVGVLMKLCGGRCDLLFGRGALRVLFYPHLRDAWRGMQKNVAVEGAAGLASYAGLVAALAAVELSPFAALASRVPWLAALGAAAALATTLSTALALRANNGRVAPALGWPLGSALFFVGMARAGVLSFVEGGAWWRDTFYPNAELRAGRRVMSPRARRELAEWSASAEKERRAG